MTVKGLARSLAWLNRGQGATANPLKEKLLDELAKGFFHG